MKEPNKLNKKKLEEIYQYLSEHSRPLDEIPEEEAREMLATITKCWEETIKPELTKGQN